MAEEARAAGIRQTPSFVVDGRVVAGGAYEPLAAAIEAALGERP
jgi:predicted DsbA family dithiol-disulfide isomerase